RYANGSTASRPMTVTVNGSAVATLDFPPTGSWDSWATATVTATLATGANTVRLAATTATGGPNLDFLDVATARPPPSRHAAESAVGPGTTDTNHLGCCGAGFCNTTNAVGAPVQWAV